jgi:hypothetical protein
MASSHLLADDGPRFYSEPSDLASLGSAGRPFGSHSRHSRHSLQTSHGHPAPAAGAAVNSPFHTSASSDLGFGARDGGGDGARRGSSETQGGMLGGGLGSGHGSGGGGGGGGGGAASSRLAGDERYSAFAGERAGGVPAEAA